MAVYHINKGINKPIEFKGLKAQYIGFLAAGLVALLIGFTVLYLLGVPVIICIVLVSALSFALIYHIFRLSKKYGEHGLMKKAARKFLPSHLKFRGRQLFINLKATDHES